MSEIKVNSIKGVSASAAAVTVHNSDGTCTLASGSKLNNCTTDGTTNFTIADGNLVIGTDGHGIDFSAQTTAGSNYTKDSELLDHYEEGTFTPNISSPQLNSVQLPAFTDASFQRRNGNYIKIGRFVAFNAEIHMHASTIAFANGDGTQTLAITGCFPFAKSTSTRPAASPCAIKYSGNSTFTNENLYADATSHFSPPFIRVFKSGSSGLVGQNINSIFQTNSFVIISGFYMADA